MASENVKEQCPTKYARKTISISSQEQNPDDVPYPSGEGGGGGSQK